MKNSRRHVLLLRYSNPPNYEALTTPQKSSLLFTYTGNRMIPFFVSKLFKLITGICFFMLSFHATAQQQNNHWIFGYGAKVRFTGGVPNGALFSSIQSNEACASVSDPHTGDLLFYTDGVKIWNTNNILMPNGSGLFGGLYGSNSQGPIIVPFPENSSKYYVFTPDELEFDTPVFSYTGIHYSVVDMTLDGGLGDVVPGQKNILLSGDSITEKMTIIKSDAIRGYWLISHSFPGNKFYAYKINSCGLDTVPVISSVGTPLVPDPFDFRLQGYGTFKANPAGTLLGNPINGTEIIEFFDFDNATGIFSNPLKIRVPDNSPTTPPLLKWGTCFSPDGSKFYFTNTASVYQLDLTIYDSLSVASSLSLINTPAFPVFHIEQAPNGKLYVAMGNVNRLDEISQPNNLGAACAYINNSVNLFGTCQLSLPAIVPDRIFQIPKMNFAYNCTTRQLTASIVGIVADSINWNMGVPGSNLSGNPVTYTYADSGWVTITANINGACYSVSSDSVFQVSDCFCTNTSATINVTSCELYISPGGKFYDVTGTYLDTISNAAGCDSLLTINLLVTGFPLATASATPSTCNLINGTATASATGGGGTYNYTWSNGATGSLISGLAEGTYTVSVTDQNGCPAQAQVSVGNIPAADVRVIASDTLILLGDTVKISVLNGDNYLWTPSAGLNCTDCASVLAFPSRNTTYFVTGKDAAGCVYSRSVTIVVDIVCNELFVPDIFSPNGMGNPENEKICVYSNCIKEMTFGIYNRWGELIYLTSDINACWDGTHKGVTAMTGVYAYRLFVEQLDGNKIERTGKITLTK